ncbi:MAG: hypothetical protein IJJ23_11105 [Clostridia bacterium]|nr:hypothetical protein [Clostridia bacterium]
MKELRKNMRLVGALLIILFIGVGGWFGYTAQTQGSRWMVSSYNSRLNSAKSSVTMGNVSDRDGYLLAWTNTDGTRQYSGDMSIRLAVSQTVGDTMGMSGTGVQTFHAGTLLGMSGSVIDRTWQWLSGDEARGDNIQLTIDANLSSAIRQAFPTGYNGAVVVTNYKTGEILAMVSMPEYDPDDLGGDVADSAFMNRCLQGQYTPGSTFKIVTLASALENISDIENRTFSCQGSRSFGEGVVTCLSGTAVHGNIGLRQAFVQSCNVTFAGIGYDLGSRALQRTAESFGFNDDFTFSDIMLYASQFRRDIGSVYELAWTAVGQGRLLVTPMHMAVIAGAVANQGVAMEPKLIRQISGATGMVRSRMTSAPYRRLMSSSTASIIADYMDAAVASGTGSRARISGYTVCGKTGSAEVSNDKTVQPHSWFVGYIDSETCPYAIAVVIENGGAGSQLASQLAGRVLKDAIDLI